MIFASACGTAVRLPPSPDIKSPMIASPAPVSTVTYTPMPTPITVPTLTNLLTALPTLQDAEAYYQRGLSYDYQGGFDQALADYNQALQLSPNFAVVYYDRGRIYQAQGNYDLALADYTRALQLQPDFVYAYVGRGTLYEFQGKYDLALADYNQALQFQPDFASAYWNRGLFYHRIGEYAQAIADYQTYQRLTGRLEGFMQAQIADMEAALTETPAP